MGLSGSIRADELRFDNFGVKDGLSQVTSMPSIRMKQGRCGLAHAKD